MLLCSHKFYHCRTQLYFNVSKALKSVLYVSVTQKVLEIWLEMKTLKYLTFSLTKNMDGGILYTVTRSRSLTLKSIAMSNHSDFQTYGHILNMPTSMKFGNKFGPRWHHHNFFSKLEFLAQICFGEKGPLGGLGSIFV